MERKPEVSVIMPVFNGADHIAESIGSVIRQTHKNWELIVSDDGSTDETLEVVSRFVSEDKRVFVCSGGRRQGPGAARNVGLGEARGRWIAFLDADDLWLPTKLERTLEHSRRLGSALTFTSYRKAHFPNWQAGSEVKVPETLTYRELLLSNVVNTSTVILDRHALPDFRWSETHKPEDFVAWLDILRDGLIAQGLDEPLTVYRRPTKSESSNKAKLAMQVFRVFSRVEQLSAAEVAWYFANYAVRGSMKYLKR